MQEHIPRDLMSDRLRLIRSDRTAADERLALDEGILTIDASVTDDLSGKFDLGDIMDAVISANPGETVTRTDSLARQLHGFIHIAQMGDLVICPLRRSGVIAIGQLMPGYEEGPGGTPARRVKWLRSDLPRNALMPDLMFSLTAKQRFASISRNDAMQRIRAVLSGAPDPGPGGDPALGIPDDPDALEEALLQRIASRIGSLFAGHGMADLIGEILKAKGYSVRVAPPGPDGGVDIYAGKGAFGTTDRLVVQVKSGDQRADVDVLQRLEGAMRAKADQGLLVSWGGFTRPVSQRTEPLWFELKFWTAMDVVRAFIEHYDQMPKNIRDALPLRRVWAI